MLFDLLVASKRPEQAVVALRLNQDEPWACPRCGKVCVHGSRRTLWSLLPAVCDHAIVDFSIRPDFEIGGSYVEKISTSSAIVPIQRFPIGATQDRLDYLQRVGDNLRRRLLDEARGHRRHWWGRRTGPVW